VNGGVAIDFYSCKGSISDILDRLGIIHTDPEIMSGSPVFVGTRVPLQTFFDYLEGESGLTEFLEDFPHLSAQAMKVLETQIGSTS
jgi:uncharacterized protein (DUF433 family)